MPKLTVENLTILSQSFALYKKYCTEKTEKNKELFLTPLLGVYKQAYKDSTPSDLSTDQVINLLFTDLFRAQLAAIDIFDTVTARKSIFELKKQFVDIPPSELKNILDGKCEKVLRQIINALKTKSEIFEMTCPERAAYIEKMTDEKQDHKAISFAQDLQDKISALTLAPQPMELKQLIDTYNELLNHIGSSFEREYQYSILIEQARLFREAILAKINERLNVILAMKTEFLPELEKFFSYIIKVKQALSDHLEEHIAFLETMCDKINAFHKLLEYISTPDKFKTKALQKLIALHALEGSDQDKIMTRLAVKQFVAMIELLAPDPNLKDERFSFPKLLNYIDCKKIIPKNSLNNDLGVLIADELRKKVTGETNRYKLAYYISVVSDLQINMTGKGLQKILKILLVLQKNFIATLRSAEASQYQNADFRNYEFKDFANLHVHLDTDNLKTFLSSYTIEDRALLINYRIKIEESINARIDDRLNKNSFRM